MKKSNFIFTFLFLIICTQFSSFQKNDLLIGKWKNEKHGVEVKIYKKEKLYFGNVIEAGNKKGNEKLRKGEVMQILKNFRKTSDSTYCCGTIYIPKTGTTIKSTIKIMDKDNLIVSGYILGFRTSSKWKRI